MDPKNSLPRPLLTYKKFATPTLVQKKNWHAHSVLVSSIPIDCYCSHQYLSIELFSSIPIDWKKKLATPTLEKKVCHAHFSSHQYLSIDPVSSIPIDWSSRQYLSIDPIIVGHAHSNARQYLSIDPKHQYLSIDPKISISIDWPKKSIPIDWSKKVFRSHSYAHKPPLLINTYRVTRKKIATPTSLISHTYRLT